MADGVRTDEVEDDAAIGEAAGGEGGRRSRRRGAGARDVRSETFQ